MKVLRYFNKSSKHFNNFINIKVAMKSKKSKIYIDYEESNDTSIINNIDDLEIKSITKIRKADLIKKHESDKIKAPKYFDDQWEKISIMRKSYDAPVDTMGIECCPDKEETRETYKFQTLVSLILSSQTKDPTTFAAMTKLIKHGLTIDKILVTEDDKIKELIHGVNFHNNKTKYIKSVIVYNLVG